MSHSAGNPNAWFDNAWSWSTLDQGLLASEPLATYAALLLTEQLRRLARFSLTGSRPGLQPGLRADDHFARQHRTPVRMDTQPKPARRGNCHE